MVAIKYLALTFVTYLTFNSCNVSSQEIIGTWYYCFHEGQAEVLFSADSIAFTRPDTPVFSAVYRMDSDSIFFVDSSGLETKYKFQIIKKNRLVLKTAIEDEQIEFSLTRIPQIEKNFDRAINESVKRINSQPCE